MTDRRRTDNPESVYRDNINTLVRKVVIIALVVGCPTMAVGYLRLADTDPVVRWGYPPVVAYLLVYGWVLLRRPGRVIRFSRMTLVLLDVAWLAGMLVRLRLTDDVTAAWSSLFPTILMGFVIFVVVGFLFFSPRGALIHSGVLTVAAVSVGIGGMWPRADGTTHIPDMVRFGINLAVISLLLHVLSRAKARLSTAVAAAQHATDEAHLMRDMAYRDALTGVANRRRLVEELTFQAGRVDPDYPVAIVYFDLDKFKAVNDVYGHAVGDDVLRGVAEIAERQVRSVDLVARLGGEEFVIVAPGTGPERAQQLAERLRGSLPEELTRVAGVAVTASFGVVTLRRGESASAVLDRVDGLMYEAKTTGRDRVVSAVA